MNAELKQFLENAKQRTDVRITNVSRPTEWMLGHLDEYNFQVEPVSMDITYNSNDEAITISAVVPFELYSKSGLPPVEEFNKLVQNSLHQRVTTFFICPDKIDSLPFMGFSMKPVKFSPIGQVLVRRLNKLEKVVHGNIFRKVGSEMLSVNVDVVGLSKQVQDSDEIIDIDYSYPITLAECEDITQHDRILKEIEDNIGKLV